MDRRKGVLLLVLVFGAAGKVCADMVQVSGAGVKGPTLGTAGDLTDQQSFIASDVFLPSAIVDLSSVHIGLFVEAQADTGGVAGSQPAYVLSDRQDGLGLCLYALLGLGLCKSGPWVKKLSLGVVPGWYHDGGPFQIGHSSVISPDCLDVACACFMQAEQYRAGPQCRRETTGFLRGMSKFSPTGLASCGPPGPSRESTVP